MDNLVEFKKKPRETNMRVVRKNYDSCKHSRVFVEEETRSVTCRDCKTSLDAFQVLLEMAHKERRWLEELDEWDARRDSMLGERYDEEWAERRDDISAPPSSPDLRKVWDVFHAYYKEKFCGMYRRKARLRTGPEWYGRDNRGGCVSFEYARHQITAKVESVAK